MLKLKALLDRLGVSQRACGEAAGMSPATMTQIILRNHWPKRRDRAAVIEEIKDFLRAAGATDEDLAGAFEGGKGETEVKEVAMLLRRQGLFPETKRHFGLPVDPFTDDVRTHEDVFLSKDIRYVREAMFHTARHGGFLAVVGESGSGKSTLRRDLLDRITREGLQVQIVEPYVLGMEDNDKTGKTLKALHIAEAIMATVAPLKKVVSSPEARFRQLHTALRESSRAGNAHVLIIEEAHGLSIPTLKHLKRFLELEDGFKRLLGIILLGQPELKQKLNEGSHEVREVVQRCEMVELTPMNGSLVDYLRFKLARVGADLDKVIVEEGLEALRAKLTGPSSMRGSRDSVSLVYPLAVGNMLTAAMNMAAELGVPQVTADVIKSV
jgi:type II secretory pathway predicted ATPase ExeA